MGNIGNKDNIQDVKSSENSQDVIQRREFYVKIQDICMNFKLVNNHFFQIKGYPQSKPTSQSQIQICINSNPQMLKYNAIYEDISLPYSIHKQFPSVDLLFTHLQKHKNQLILSKSQLLFNSFQIGLCLQAQSKCQMLHLPLDLLAQNKQSNTQNKDLKKYDQRVISIKSVGNRSMYPYNSVVRVVSIYQDNTKIVGSGFLINKTTVLTAAHNIYIRTSYTEVKQVLVHIQENQIYTQLKVVQHKFSKQYKTANHQDLHKYDFAYLTIQKNDFIKDDQILGIKQNWNKNSVAFQVVWISNEIKDQHQPINQMSFDCYHLKCDKFIQITQNYAFYSKNNHISSFDMSGGPILIQESGIYKVIGLHQCFVGNLSKIILFKDTKINLQEIFIQMQEEKNEQLRIKGDNLYIQGQKQFDLNNLKEANTLFIQCLMIRRQFPGNSSIQYADAMHMLCIIRFYQKKYDLSLRYYEKCLLIKQKAVGKNHEKYLKTLMNIACIHYVKGDYDKSIKLYQDSNKIIQQSEISNRLTETEIHADLMLAIGIVSAHKNRFENLLQSYKHVKEIYDETVGKVSLKSANLSFNVGLILWSLGNSEKGLSYLKQCIEIMKQTKNQNHPYFQIYNRNLQKLERKLQKSKKQVREATEQNILQQ